MNEKRKAAEEKLAAQLAEWDAQIALLDAKAAKAQAEAKIEYLKTIEALQVKRAGAKATLAQLKAAGDEAWEDLKTGAEKVWDDVKTTFHEAMTRFE